MYAVPTSGVLPGVCTMKPSRILSKHDLEQMYIPEPNSGCWLWLLATNANGYGVVHFRGASRLAHRVSMLLFRGEVPDGMAVLHQCDTPSCVNPDHLRFGTMQDNQSDMARKRRGSKGRLPYGVRKQNGAGYVACIQFRNVKFYLGQYPSIEEAHRVARAKRAEFYGA